LSIFIAVERFLCCERSCWQETTMLVGMWVMADRGVRLVDVLPPRTGRAERVHAKVVVADLDLDVVVHDRIDEHARERGMPTRLRVEGGDSHQTVNALLRLQVAVSRLALDLERRAFDAGFLPRLHVEHVHLEAVPLRPARVHAREHLGPILRLRAARAGVDREQRIAVILLPLEHRAQLELLESRLDLLQIAAPLRFELLVRLLGEEVDELGEVGRPLGQVGPGGDPLLVLVGFRDDYARIVRPIPEPRGGHTLVELDQALLATLDVKGTPGARGAVRGPGSNDREARCSFCSCCS
jgi:hypothetical protein